VRRLLDRGVVAEADLERIEQETAQIVTDAVRFAEESPEPTRDG
jgi:TPP-dependent pyruvate/acetoin dehydrogenase alpha subunit